MYGISARAGENNKAENNRLSEQLKSDEFIYGAYAILLGIIATLIIQYFARSRRRSSEWR